MKYFPCYTTEILEGARMARPANCLGETRGWGHGRKMPNGESLGSSSEQMAFVVSISRNSWCHNDDNFIHSKPLQHYYYTRFRTYKLEMSSSYS